MQAHFLHRALAALGPVAILSIAGGAAAIGVALRLVPGGRGRHSGRPVLRPLRQQLGRPSPFSTALCLSAIVVLAALFRGSLSEALHVPVVLGDELIYEGLAKGWALQGEPLLRGSRDLADSVFYPLLLAPAFRVAADESGALTAAKLTNTAAMAVTAVPAYLLARRVVPRGWALGVAALTVIAPWTMYAALIMTESLFYPVFVAYAAIVVWTIEKPTVLRQAAMLGTLAFLVGVRAQGLTLALGTVVAIVLCAALDDRSSLADIRRFLPTLVVFGAVAAIGIGASRTGLAVPTSSYNVVFSSLGQAGGILKWALWSVAMFEFPLGVVALAAFPVALRGMLSRNRVPVVRSTAAVAVCLSVSVLASVALLSASPYGLNHLHERNLFYVTPLLLTCLAYWLSQGMTRPLVLSAVSAGVCLALAWVLPERLIHSGNNVDVPSASFFLALEARMPGVPLRVWLVLFAAVGVATFLVARTPLFPIFTVVLAFVAVTAAVDYHDDFTPRQVQELAWVDHDLPSGVSANLVYLGGRFQNCNANAGAQSGLTLWTEWFNARVASVEYIGGANPADGLPPPTQLTVDPDGTVRRSGKPFRPRYVVLDSRQPIMGDRLRRFDLSRITGREDQRPPASLTLWQVDAPLRFKLLKLNPSNLRRRGNNLIPNGGFARGVNGWNGNTGTETVTVDRGAAGTAGGNSMVVRTSGRLFSGVFFSQKLNVLPRAAYVFSFRVRGKPGQTVLPTLEWYSASKSPSSIVQTSGVPLTGSWQLVTVDYTAPRRSTRVVPAIVLKGTAKTIIRIDAVRLARGSSATPGICPR